MNDMPGRAIGLRVIEVSSCCRQFQPIIGCYSSWARSVMMAAEHLLWRHCFVISMAWYDMTSIIMWCRHLDSKNVQATSRVSSFKLLGVHVDSSLCWSIHINSITRKASTRLYFLKQLKRAGLSSNHLLYYHTSVIRPALEYCVPVWHYALTKDQSQQIERIQKRAIHIIFNFYLWHAL